MGVTDAGGNVLDGVFLLEVQPNGMELTIEYVPQTSCRINYGNWSFTANAAAVYR